jgi:hypothetical protein
MTEPPVIGASTHRRGNDPLVALRHSRRVCTGAVAGGADRGIESTPTRCGNNEPGSYSRLRGGSNL